MTYPYFEILLRLPLYAIPKLACSCRSIATILKSDYFWEQKAKTDFDIFKLHDRYSGIQLYRHLIAPFFDFLDALTGFDRDAQRFLRSLCSQYYHRQIVDPDKLLLLTGCSESIEILMEFLKESLDIKPIVSKVAATIGYIYDDNPIDFDRKLYSNIIVIDSSEIKETLDEGVLRRLLVFNCRSLRDCIIPFGPTAHRQFLEWIQKVEIKVDVNTVNSKEIDLMRKQTSIGRFVNENNLRSENVRRISAPELNDYYARYRRWIDENYGLRPRINKISFLEQIKFHTNIK